MQYVIEKLTELLIKQDIKDKKIGKKELISKVGAYKSLIDLLKELESEKDINSIIAYTNASKCKNIY